MFNLQLANTYNPTKNYGLNSWWANPKLDGVRGLYIIGQGLMSRTQKQKYVGLEHIESVCQQIAAAGYQVIDGELYIANEKFDVISGIVRDRKNYDINQKLRVQFHVFALWSNSKIWTNTEEMIQAILSIVPNNQTAVVAVPYIQVENSAIAIQTQNQLNRDTGASAEGTMLRHPDVAYNQGRSNHLLKVKNFEKSEFIIKGFVRGTGKYKNSLGKLTVEGTINGAIRASAVYANVTAKVGTGFTDAERLEFWNNQTTYLNQKAEIIYMGVTSNKSLRHPVFSKILPPETPYLYGFPSRSVNPTVKFSDGNIQVNLGNQLDTININYNPSNPPPAIKVIWDGKTLVEKTFRSLTRQFNFSGQANIKLKNQSFEQWLYDNVYGYFENPEPYKEGEYQYSIEKLDVPGTFTLEGSLYFYDGSFNGMVSNFWSRTWSFNGLRLCYLEERYNHNPHFRGKGATFYTYSIPIINLTLNQ